VLYRPVPRVLDAVKITGDTDPNLNEREPPPEQGLLAHRLFCRCNFSDRRSFDFSLLSLFIGFVQEPINDARTLLLLDLSVLRFLLFSEEPVVYFPTHWILHL